MTDETETDTEEQKAEDHNSRGNIGAGDIPAIKELPNSFEKTLNNKQSVICHRESPLYTNGSASRTAMTNLIIT